MNIENLTAEEQDALFMQLKEKKDRTRLAQRDAYEGLKKSFCADVHKRAGEQHSAVTLFYNWLTAEVEGFRSVMAEYGQVANNQMNFTISDGDFRLEVKSNKVKRFDERADLAAVRLVKFLKDWVKNRDAGTDDPMYQLAMLALERNQKGDLDYKQVSNLYKLEGMFNDPEYSSIMELFRESHIIEGTATHFYFYRRDENNVWRRIEISFNRL